MPRWDRRFRIVLDWTISLFFRPELTTVDRVVERDQTFRDRQMQSDAHAEGAFASTELQESTA